jgi:hypothetical protein
MSKSLFAQTTSGPGPGEIGMNMDKFKRNTTRAIQKYSSLEDDRVGSHGDGGQVWPVAWRKRLLVAFWQVIAGHGERQQNLLLASEGDPATQGSQKHGVFVWMGGGWSRSAVAIGRHSIGCRPSPPGTRPARRRSTDGDVGLASRGSRRRQPPSSSSSDEARRRTCLVIRCLAPQQGMQSTGSFRSGRYR